VSAGNFPSEARSLPGILKTGSQLSFWRDHSARPDSTQLSRRILKISELSDWRKTLWSSSVELSRVGRVIIAPDSVWSLSRPDSTQLNCQLSWVQLSWVVSGAMIRPLHV